MSARYLTGYRRAQHVTDDRREEGAGCAEVRLRRLRRAHRSPRPRPGVHSAGGPETPRLEKFGKRTSPALGGKCKFVQRAACSFISLVSRIEGQTDSGLRPGILTQSQSSFARRIKKRARGKREHLSMWGLPANPMLNRY